MENIEMLIYLKSGELHKEATVRKFRTVRQEDKTSNFIVKCSLKRFSKDFIFQLAKKGLKGLRLQNET